MFVLGIGINNVFALELNMLIISFVHFLMILSFKIHFLSRGFVFVLFLLLF